MIVFSPFSCRCMASSSSISMANEEFRKSSLIRSRTMSAVRRRWRISARHFAPGTISPSVHTSIRRLRAMGESCASRRRKRCSSSCAYEIKTLIGEATGTGSIAMKTQCYIMQFDRGLYNSRPSTLPHAAHPAASGRAGRGPARGDISWSDNWICLNRRWSATRDRQPDRGQRHNLPADLARRPMQSGLGAGLRWRGEKLAL